MKSRVRKKAFSETSINLSVLLSLLIVSFSSLSSGSSCHLIQSPIFPMLIQFTPFFSGFSLVLCLLMHDRLLVLPSVGHFGSRGGSAEGILPFLRRRPLFVVVVEAEKKEKQGNDSLFSVGDDAPALFVSRSHPLLPVMKGPNDRIMAL